MHWGYGMGGWMMLFWVLLAAAVLVLMVWAIVRSGAQASTPAGASAEDILRERYARGEITREQFDQMLADLRR